MDVSLWHSRYEQQAAWTKPLRDYLFQQASPAKFSRSLDVGCGTGILLKEFGQRDISERYGLDISSSNLAYSRRFCGEAYLIRGDAHILPFPNHFFDLTVCHFLLLWAANPMRVVEEMKRVTRPGGYIFVLAEPDYGGRIDYPAKLGLLANWQVESLKQQGADPYLGRKLTHIFKKNHLSTNGGIIGSQWPEEIITNNETSADLEWEVIRSDLSRLQPSPPQAQVEEVRKEYQSALTSGEKMVFIPTFYDWSQVP